ncbi:MAG: hypothetical protein AAF984_06960 [Verrucomicrobiota bacterium]
MRFTLILGMLLLFAPLISSQENEVLQPLKLEIENKSLFEGLSARALVYFPPNVIPADEASLPSDTEAISFLRQEIVESGEAESQQAVMILTFLPRRSGLITFPSLSWNIQEIPYATQPRQCYVGSLKKSDLMRLSVTPAKTKIYVGEPVRMDVRWECDLQAGALRQLKLNPPFFFKSNVQVDIPRSNVPEKDQIGLPVGGRRIIAKRDLLHHKDQLGQISFSVFIRFTEPGAYAYAPTRLELFHLKNTSGRFAPYASYFNNTLFDRLESASDCEYLYQQSEPLQFEVLHLPLEKQDGSFSGLFEPCRIESSVEMTQGDVGQLMELSLRIFSEVSSGFLELPALSQQKSLRHRFWVDNQLRRIWQPDGAEFRVRFRPLTTSVRAFPELAFQVFDPQAGRYRFKRTSAIPLEINQNNSVHCFGLFPEESQRFF